MTRAAPASRTVFAAVCWAASIAAARGAEGDASFAETIERGQIVAARELLQAGADVDESQADGMTALHWAIVRDDAALVADLLQAGADAKRATRYGVTPLSMACERADARVVELLLDAGADPNAAGRGGVTPLMIAARAGRIEPVRVLLDRGAAVDARERNEQTALMWAAAEGHVEVVRALLAAGADHATPLRSGFTPLLFAVRGGHAEVAFALVDAGADIDQAPRPRRAGGATGLGRGVSPLLMAVENGHFELAARLLDAGADPNETTSGYSPLHAITWVRKADSGDDNALPPPDGSGTMSSLDFVRKLVAHGADVNMRHRRKDQTLARLNKRGATPFLLAADTADVELMRLLVELGADPTIANEDNTTALMVAAGVGTLAPGEEAGTEEESLEAVKYALELGGDVNAVDKNGETAMHGAAYKSAPEIVRFLAAHGADEAAWNHRNSQGWTPLLIAQGYRPGNFKPAPDTIAALRSIMQDPHAPDLEPPKRGDEYSK
jgi:ankyrin repeat protein